MFDDVLISIFYLASISIYLCSICDFWSDDPYQQVALLSNDVVAIKALELGKEFLAVSLKQ